jgi:MFS family permease
MYVFAGVFGLGLGGEYLIIPLMAAELFGVGVLGRVMGIVLTADGVAEATAPMLVGYLRGRSGSYNMGFITLIGAALVGAIAIALLPRTGQRMLAAGAIARSPVPSPPSPIPNPQSRIPNPQSRIPNP